MAINKLNISNISSYIRNNILNKNIGEKNIFNNEINSPIDVTYSSLIPIDSKRNNYINYLDYINNVYGTNNSLINILGGIVSGEGVSLSLNSNSDVGIISNFDIQSVLAGRIISTLTGYDTPIGTFGIKAAAVTMLNNITSKAEKLTFNLETSLLSKFNLNDSYINYDTSISINPNEPTKIFGISTTTDILNGIEDILDIKKNTLTNKKLSQRASIYSLENGNVITSDSILSNLTSGNNTNQLISSTGKFGVSILYDLLNQNLYLPNYENDSRFKNFGLNSNMFSNYYNLFNNYEIGFDSNNPSDVIERAKNNNTYKTWLNKGDTLTNSNSSITAFTPITNDNIFQSNQISSYDANGKPIFIFPNSGRLKSLLDKTNILFTQGKINTMISSYSYYDKNETINNDEIQSSYDPVFGISRGRNLLRKDSSIINNNPYCRVWTWQNQYNKFQNTIRHGNISNQVYPFRINNNALKNYSALDSNNGIVNIAPYDSTTIKNYMFSIENLAWKGLTAFNRDNTELSGIEFGNNGGRVMWFPPYDIKFDENTNVQIESNLFIGRGEPVYTYTNTERKGNLTFKLIVDHPALINYYNENKNMDVTTDGDSNDLLRFFAGCDILDLTQSQPTISQPVKTESASSNSLNTITIKLVSIYFPNDYSGINDKDVIIYLYQGQGNTISKDTTNTGYEGASATGLSNVTFNCNILNDALIQNRNTNNKTLNLSTSNISNYNNDDQQYRRDNTNYNYTYYYNYYDTENYNLNNIAGNNQYSFRDFYKIASDSTNINYKNLINLLTTSGSNINITGYASEIGPIEANQTLAKNRANVIADFLKTLVPASKFTTKAKISTYVSTCVSDLGSKQTRRVDITLIIPKDAKIYRNPNIKQIVNSNTINQAVVSNLAVKNYAQYESDFFQKIKDADPLVQKTIQKQIKNFHPAFHSTTPEGFNTRLTFLHQCTRQGPTVGQTDSNMQTASNLSFGRPPVSVLRIGDFYNTKIMINSLNISYEPLVWDLNPEGIGVQPMIANIVLSFNFIGGSDLSGPIARLQNAITSNFFANTSVYDNRSDTVNNTNATTAQITANPDLALFNPSSNNKKK
jgi:outer membrane protein OmpA-like peptidoglycan-associated protein